MAHPMSDELRNKTCGELSCDDCNQQREKSADELDRMHCIEAKLRDFCDKYPTDWVYRRYIFDILDS